VSTERLNDLDLLGPPRACRRLPASTIAAIALLLVVLMAIAIVGKALA